MRRGSEERLRDGGVELEVLLEKVAEDVREAVPVCCVAGVSIRNDWKEKMGIKTRWLLCRD